MPVRVSKPNTAHALGWLCMDCGENTHASNEYYALKDSVWRRINPLILGMLCLKCAEDRLGRSLARSDFSAAPINARSAQNCPELADRLRRVRPKSAAITLPKRDLQRMLSKKSKTQSHLGRISAALLEHSRPDGRLSRKDFMQVIRGVKSHKVS
jgi:hypothetical protein